jgi:hypothetical protein
MVMSQDQQRNVPPGHRGMRLASLPTRSVVVASSRGRDALEATLGSLLDPCARLRIEVVVARSCGVEEYRELVQAFPTVLFMPGPDGATAQQLRAVGLSAADGDIVHLMGDERPVDAAWFADFAPPEAPAAGPPPPS